jgi:hypothetical protein
VNISVKEAFLVNNDCYIANVNRADSRYVTFQNEGPKGLMLHSVGCAQPSAEVFANGWNKSGVEKAVHAFIDANTGVVWQTLPWFFRGWHAGGSANNTHVGVEMCESSYITYITPSQFTVKDLGKARADCKRAYDTAVGLFAVLCKKYGLNPAKDIISHKEGGEKGIASGHKDPELYWSGLGLGYTMATFRAAVKAELDPKTPFVDVPDGAYYTDAVRWAWENGLVSGTDPTHFSPKASIKRCDVCVILKRFYEIMKGGG